MKSDEEYMALAIQLARNGRYTCHPNPRVGSVIVNEGAIVAQGWHEKTGSAHAEINALRQAGNLAQGATVYVSLEPCCFHGRTGPCTDALIKAGVKRVVVAALDPNPKVSGKGIEILKAAGIEVVQGVLEHDAQALNPGFNFRMQKGRPFVRCKLAMSLDGKTAMASGESKWITGTQAREDVHRYRARSSAIISGIGTILADDPELTVRLDEITSMKHFQQPKRVILDPRLSTPPFAKILSDQAATQIITVSDDAEIAAELIKAGADIIYQSEGMDSIDLAALMTYLAEQEMNEVLVETGATLSGAVLQAGYVDELVIYMAPHLMGNNARGLFHLNNINLMSDRIDLEITDIRAFGNDWRIIAKVKT